MKKIPSVFKRNYDSDCLVRNEVVPGCEWVLEGEGDATTKYDGTCCMFKDGDLYRRYDCKRGRTPPEGFIPAQPPDEITGHWPGWVLVEETNKSDKWFMEAYKRYGPKEDGTYELCGPHFQGNPENVPSVCGDMFIRHGITQLLDVPRDFEGIKEYLKNHYIEGIVFHRSNGDMAKIKRVDFGFEWAGKTTKR